MHDVCDKNGDDVEQDADTEDDNVNLPDDIEKKRSDTFITTEIDQEEVSLDDKLQSVEDWLDRNSEFLVPPDCCEHPHCEKDESTQCQSKASPQQAKDLPESNSKREDQLEWGHS